MTETFYLRVDIESKESLEFYEQKEDSDDEVELPPNEKINKKFNTQVEKQIKKTLIKDVREDFLSNLLEEDEGVDMWLKSILEEAAQPYYDPESDLTAITEMMTPGIKFTVIRKPRK